jgi:hypothetical protein
LQLKEQVGVIFLEGNLAQCMKASEMYTPLNLALPFPVLKRNHPRCAQRLEYENINPFPLKKRNYKLRKQGLSK